MEAVYEPTDLGALTADLTSVFRAAVERAGLRLFVECPGLDRPVYVDREMWEKIVLNLLSNAFKFTLEGEIAVVLRAAGDRVELLVRDSGIGIAAENLPHIFERFHRVRGARARAHEGTGIGLALVQELVKLHGGTIEVASELDRGTTASTTAFACWRPGSRCTSRSPSRRRSWSRSLPVLPVARARPDGADARQAAGAVGSSPARGMLGRDKGDR